MAVGSSPSDTLGEPGEGKVKRDVEVEVNGRRFAVSVWVPEGEFVSSGRSGAPKAAPRARTSGGAGGHGAAALFDGTEPLRRAVR